MIRFLLLTQATKDCIKKITQDTFTPNHEMEHSMSVLQQYQELSLVLILVLCMFLHVVKILVYRDWK